MDFDDVKVIEEVEIDYNDELKVVVKTLVPPQEHNK